LLKELLLEPNGLLEVLGVGVHGPGREHGDVVAVLLRSLAILGGGGGGGGQGSVLLLRPVIQGTGRLGALAAALAREHAAPVRVQVGLEAAVGRGDQRS